VADHPRDPSAVAPRPGIRPSTSSSASTPRRPGRAPCSLASAAFIALAAAAAASSPASAIAGPPSPDPAADVVVSYVPGETVPFGFDDPASALGPPARFSGVGIEPGVVSPFQPALTPVELVSIGRGGSLVVAFDEPVTDDPANPFGVDLLVFGNAFFADAAYPAAIVGGLFAEGGTIEVSADGVIWTLVAGAVADGGWPTLGWLDAGPYDQEPGREPTDFTRPLDPAITPADATGWSWPELQAFYGDAGGGTPIDLAPLGLNAITHVRISVAVDAPSAIEVDALMDVAPGSGGLPEDVDGDGTVGFGDVLTVLAAWGECPAPPADCGADVDASDAVDFADVLAVLAAWTGS